MRTWRLLRVQHGPVKDHAIAISFARKESCVTPTGLRGGPLVSQVLLPFEVKFTQKALLDGPISVVITELIQAISPRLLFALFRGIPSVAGLVARPTRGNTAPAEHLFK